MPKHRGGWQVSAPYSATVSGYSRAGARSVARQVRGGRASRTSGNAFGCLLMLFAFVLVTVFMTAGIVLVT